MVGDIFILYFIMLIVAGLAFAPLGYFIYMYTEKNGEPFGDIEPHGDSESKILDLAGQLVGKIQGLMGKNK